jgi:hypothetical protein
MDANVPAAAAASEPTPTALRPLIFVSYSRRATCSAGRLLIAHIWVDLAADRSFKSIASPAVRLAPDPGEIVW